MTQPRHLQIAIDGPAASGKTTIAHALARSLKILYLDTGAMYRTLAHLALENGTEADNEGALVRLWGASHASVQLDESSPLGFRITAFGKEIGERILQSTEVTSIVSTIAAHPRVREAMVHSQRAIADRGPVVMAGRDIGTVVLPFAPVKIFLTASSEARVERRRAQLQEAGVDVSSHQLSQEIEERDRLDRERSASPLVPAQDSHVVDSSNLGIDDVLKEITDLVERLK